MLKIHYYDACNLYLLIWKNEYTAMMTVPDAKQEAQIRAKLFQIIWT